MHDTICAVATPPGQGGLGVVRISGANVTQVAAELIGSVPPPRQAALRRFRDGAGELIDQGIAIYYQAPSSYTGEDVLELQGHGSPIALQRIIEHLLTLDVRLAHPGEFTQRAFLNKKLDLTQAEAVADLIASSSKEAASAALRSYSGEFAKKVDRIDKRVLKLRVYIEGSLDFADEEIDHLEDNVQTQELNQIISELSDLLDQTYAGQSLLQGIDVVIAGEPNVGKSSLLNALLGEARAIVTPIAGTTRDTLEGTMHLDGLPLRLVDTAGLHETAATIEKEGIQRAKSAIEQADLVLWVLVDGTALEEEDLSKQPTIRVLNKCDLTGKEAGRVEDGVCRVSAKFGKGLSDLKSAIKRGIGFSARADAFAGRPRHIAALKEVDSLLKSAADEIRQSQPDLVAENLRTAHERLGEIVGITTPDELLGEIFSTFCIGK